MQIIPDRSFYDHLVPLFRLRVHISVAFHDNHLFVLSFCLEGERERESERERDREKERERETETE